MTEFSVVAAEALLGSPSIVASFKHVLVKSIVSLFWTGTTS